DLQAISTPAVALVERDFRILDLMVSEAVDEYARGERDLEGVYDWLRGQAHRLEQLNALDRLVIVDAAGLVRFTRRPEGLGLDVSARDYFRHHRGAAGAGMHMSAPIRVRVPPHDLATVVSWGVRDGAGRFAGVVAAVASWPPFARAFADLADQPNQTVALVNHAGDVLALDQAHWPDSREAPSRPPFLLDGGVDDEPEGGWRDVAGFMVTKAAIPVPRLYVLAGQPLTDILRPWSRRLQVAAALVLIMAASAGWLIGQLHHHVQRLRASVATAKAARTQAELGERAKAHFLAAMSHEIRTPMTGVLGMADLLATEPLLPNQRKYVQSIQASGRHLLNVINDVLDFSRLGAGGLVLERIDFELADTIEQVRSIMSPVAIERGLELRVMIADEVPPALVGDPTRLRQILLNLVGNGLKFTPSGGVTVAVADTSAAGVGQALRFEVRDSGIGIPQHRLDTLFQPFVQLDASTARRFGGSGLGLAICRELVRLQNGRVGVESEPSRGSLFWFELPLEIGHVEPPGEAPPEPGPTPTRRILVAEDVEVNQDLLCAGLVQAGHQVVVAGNGVEAVQKAATERFDVVLMDVQMPMMDGIEATGHIRALPPPAGSVPIFALTANVMDQERHHCLRAGMDRVLGKPIVWPELLSALAALDGRPAVEPKPEPTDTEADAALLDLAVIDGMAAHLPPEILTQLLQRGMAGAEESCGRLRAVAGDPGALRREAHRLRGTSGSFGLARIAALAGQIEDGGEAVDVVGLLAALEEAMAATRTAMAEHLLARQLPA
ncbi:MAG: ATP-binding protein, partial [Geminicoccaceae bacterium]